MRCLIRKAGWMVVLGIMLSITPRLQAEQTIKLSEALSPPGWALLQQQLLHANSEACRIFFDRYFDERVIFCAWNAGEGMMALTMPLRICFTGRFCMRWEVPKMF